MSTAEEEDNFRLRKSAEHVTHYQDAENKARRDLAEATASLRRAREKHSTLFQECEARAVARIRAGTQTPSDFSPSP
jgi:hypothetical protein